MDVVQGARGQAGAASKQDGESRPVVTDLALARFQNQIAAALATQTDRQTTLTSVLGTMTNADAATAATNLTQAQTAFQASAQVFNTLKGMSLLNFLSSGATVP